MKRMLKLTVKQNDRGKDSTSLKGDLNYEN